jgi:hypothetical protein
LSVEIFALEELMRRIGYLTALVALVVVGSVRSQPKDATDSPEAAKPDIVPVVVLKPGERQELFFSTTCTVGITRGGGLKIRELGGQGDSTSRDGKAWGRNGVNVKAPDFSTAMKEAADPRFKAFNNTGLALFRLEFTAAKDAKEDVYNLHLADYTCNGTCKTDLRVLVTAP